MKMLAKFSSFIVSGFHDLEIQYFPILLHFRQEWNKYFRNLIVVVFSMLLFEKKKKKPFVDIRSYINSRWLGFTGSSIKQSFGQAPTVLWWWDPSEAVFLYFSCYDTCYISSLWKWKVHGKGGAVGFVCLKQAHSEGETRNVFNTISVSFGPNLNTK